MIQRYPPAASGLRGLLEQRPAGSRRARRAPFAEDFVAGRYAIRRSVSDTSSKSLLARGWICHRDLLAVGGQ